MNYTDIDDAIKSIGMGQDQALKDTKYVIEDIPCDCEGCPLGLYDSDRNIIILPPNMTKAALIHEIGHRIGHFYANDLSEEFAEGFRSQYMPLSVVMFTGSRDNFSSINAFEPMFKVGDKGLVEMLFAGRLSYLQEYTMNELSKYMPKLTIQYTNTPTGDSKLNASFVKCCPIFPLISSMGIVGIDKMQQFDICK